jgi:ABC-2 type transport system permease protein
MMNLLRSEVLKIRSTQVWIWMFVLSIGVTTLFTLGSVLSISSGSDRADVDYYSIFTVSGSAGIAMLVLGLLGLTTEFRHKTITPTLLATPARWRLLTGKAIAYVIIAIPYGLACIAANIAVAVICLDAKSLPIDFGHGVPGGIVKAFLSLILLAFFGLGLGALVRNQAAGMVAGIAYLFVLNPLLSIIPLIRRAYPYEPGGALAAFNSSGHETPSFNDYHLLSPLAGGLVMLLWCLGLLAIGGYFSLQRDIS